MSASIKTLQPAGLAHLVDKIKELVTTKIQKQYNHQVTDKNAVVTDENDLSLYVYRVQCLLNGTSLRVMSLPDIDTRVFTNTRRFVWTKTADQTDCYANILSTSATAGRGVLKLTIHNTDTDTTETHYICFIEDTPTDTTFLFCTSCEWDIETRYGSNNIRAYLHVPDNFVGTITIEAERFNMKAGGLWYIIQPTSDTDNTNKTVAHISGGDGASAYLYTDGAEYAVPFFHTLNDSPLTSLTTKLRQPFGKYQVDLIYDFGTIAVGDKIPDTVVNDVLLHHITKRLNSIESLLGGQNIDALSTQVATNKTDIGTLQSDNLDIKSKVIDLGLNLKDIKSRLQKLESANATKAEIGGITSTTTTDNA